MGAFHNIAMIVAGALLMWMFETRKWYFGGALIGSHVLQTVMVVLNVRQFIRPEVFELLAHFPAAVAAAPRSYRKNQTTFRAFGSAFWLVTVALMASFLYSDLAARGALTDDDSYRLTVLLLFGSSAPVLLLAMAQGGKRSFVPAIELTVEVTRAFADSVEAGASVVDIERDLIKLRRLFVLLQHVAMMTVVETINPFMWLITNTIVCVAEPNPPAFFAAMLAFAVPLVYLAPPHSMLAMSHLARVPVAIAVRALHASDADVDANTTASAVGAEGSQLARALAATKAATAPTSGSTDKSTASGAASAAAAAAPQAVPTDAVETVATKLSQLQRDQSRQALDLLLVRLDHLKVGWYISGVPVSTALLSKLRIITVPVLGVVVREFMDSG